MKSPPIPRFPEVPGLAKYLEDLARVVEANSQPQRVTLGIGWETIEVAALTNVVSYARTGLSPFRILRAVGVAIPATNAVSAGWRTDANGGASYDAGATDYFVQDTRGKAAVASAAGPNTNAIYLNDTTTITNNAGYGLWFNIHFFEFNKATIGTIIFNAGYNDSAGVLNNVSGAAFRNSTAARDAIEFKFTAGNISTGVMILEGFRG